MIWCAHCGNQCRNESNFCAHCGNRLVAVGHTLGHLAVLGPAEREEYLLLEAERCIGRDPASDIVLADREASARHARISFADKAFWIEDMGTTNGTFVNGQRIQGRTRLSGEDLVRIGHTMLQFKD